MLVCARHTPNSRRTSKTVSTTTNYLYDVNRSLPVLLDDETRKYVWGLGLAYAVDTSGALQVYHTDGLGPVRAITDDGAGVVQTYQTDEFGVPTQTQGSSTQPFQYTGEQRDAESGFVYLRARVYDPVIGRFLQRDPFPGVVRSPISLNRYAYGLPNPLIVVDPSGLVASRITDDKTCYDPSSGKYHCGFPGVVGVPGGPLFLIWNVIKDISPGSGGDDVVRGGRRLVVGGGRARGFPSHRATDVTLNIDPRALPDVIGDITQAPFRSGSFSEVYFEKVPFSAFTGRNSGALNESARLLEPGGRLVLETGSAAPVDEVVATLRSAGFENIQVERIGFIRITAVLGGP